MERKEAIEIIKKNWPDSSFTMLREALETIIPELAESEDERIRKEIINFLELPHPQFVGKRHQEDWIAWLKLLKDRVQLQSKQEWNEDDSIMIDNILGTYKTLEDMLDLTTSQDKDILESMNFERDWLNSIKDRVHPKQEWTDDEKIFKAIHNSVDVECLSKNGLDYVIMVDWFKSIKDRVQPQNRWKPSDTEINILQGVIDGSFKPENVKVTLTNILEQLKKLRAGKLS